MLTADIREYRRGYVKHYEAYKKMEQSNSDVNSRRLLLIYGVECGLKYLLLEQWHETSLKKIIDSGDEKKKDTVTSHDLKKLIKEVGQQGNFNLPQLKTKHGGQVSSEAYHQVYRYCIQVDESEQIKEKEIEKSLKEVADWIDERM